MITAAPPETLHAVLFDLDGTLLDPAGGITDGIAHALLTHGVPVPPPAALAAMVGPKLADALLLVPGVTAAAVPAIVASYRLWYRATGMARATPYPGMAELLHSLRGRGLRLAVATQKPEALARELLSRHGLADAVDVICGAPADETLLPGDAAYRAGKTEIIAAALHGLGVTPRHAVMVGDRRHDVQGATANALPCLGVAWGFAAAGELATAGAAAVVHSAAELLTHLVARQEGHTHGTV